MKELAKKGVPLNVTGDGQEIETIIFYLRKFYLQCLAAG